MKIKVGDKVRVKWYKPIATVERFYLDMEGGAVLSRVVRGFRSWNVKDLVKVKRSELRKRK